MTGSEIENSTAMPSTAGTARLWVVGPVAFLSFFHQMFLEYLPPLYFSALKASAEPIIFSENLWSQFIKYQTTAWLIGPVLAGILARRYGERRVWCFAQFAMVPITLLLILRPDSSVIMAVGFWSGITGSLIWVGGVSFIQMVPSKKRGLSNGLMMFSLGAGSFLAPIFGRAMIYWRVLKPRLADGDWTNYALELFSFQQIDGTPTMADFFPVLWFLTFLTIVCGLLIGLFGQRPGRFAQDGGKSNWNTTFHDLGILIRNPVFWAIVISMSCFAAPIFQGSNQFLPYRAADLGLTEGAADHGWAWLNMLKTMMWIFGGAAVGLLAGRKTGAFVGIIMLAGFAIGSLGIGISNAAWQLFVWVAVFEFMRQFIRWSGAGWLSEHMPNELRATAIGVSCTLAGVSSTVFAWLAGYLWNADQAGFSSSAPFYVAFILGIIGCSQLGICNWFHSIRSPLPDAMETDNHNKSEA